MQYHFSAAALLALAARKAAAQSPTVTTPTSLVECQPAQFTVSGGTAPYYISILPGGQAGATPLEQLPVINAAGSITWNVDIPSNTAITIQVRDSTGLLNYSQQVTIQAGICVSSSSSAPTTTATSGAASGVSSPASSATTTSPVAIATGSSVIPKASSSAAAANGHSSASSAAPAVSTSTSKASAASGLQVSGLLAGVATLFAALFA